jgi:hypothetical protein
MFRCSLRMYCFRTYNFDMDDHICKVGNAEIAAWRIYISFHQLYYGILVLPNDYHY